MDNFNFDLFKQICETRAVSGDEKNMISLLRDYYVKYGDEIIYDNLGSMVVRKKCKKENAKKVLVLAHCDEIGFMVSGIENDGIIRVSPVGGISAATLLTNKVELINDDGKVYFGVVGTKSSGDIKELDFDFGFDSKEEVLENHISIGNSVCLVGDTVRINDKKIISKAIDDRYGCFLGVELLEEISSEELDVDLYVGVSVQEEVGLRGAQTIADKIRPDMAIILDCSPSDPKNNNGIIGKGVLLRVKDGNMIAFKSLINYQKEVCKINDVACQYYVAAGGTDAGAVHKCGDGILTLTHCICAKYLHSASTMINVDDYLGAKKSLIYMVKDLNTDKINELKQGNR